MKELCFLLFIVFIVVTTILEFVGIIMMILDKETVNLLSYSLLTLLLSVIFLVISQLFSYFKVIWR